MSIKKHKRGTVHFIWPDVTAQDVFLVGDFNDWDERSHRLEKISADRYELKLQLRPGRYHFKYLVDGVWWNDPDADDYEANPWGSEDSVLCVEEYEGSKHPA